MSDIKQIKLDGTMIKSDGTSQKSNYFKFLDLHPDDYSDIVYTPEQAQRIRSHLLHLSTGASAAVPMICGGVAKCPFADRCPLVIEDRRAKEEGVPNYKPVTPVGRSCLVEINLLNEWTRLYLHEYEVEENSFTEINMCRELAETELMLWRINNNIAKPGNAELVQEVVVGVDKQGTALTRQEVTALFEAKERLQNRKSKLIKLMVGDRQEKYKRDAALKTTNTSDPSTQTAQLRGRLTQLLEQAKKVDLQLKDAEGDVIDVKPDDAPLSPEDLINNEE